MKSPVVCALLGCLAIPAAGLEPYLVEDINPVPRPADSDTADFASLGGVALFAADDGMAGRELWRSDGTEAGTWQVADLCTPDCSGHPSPVAVTDRLYFFLASGPLGGDVLGVTDGTPDGTFLLAAFSTGGVRNGALWVPEQGVLYFRADDGTHGQELWRSDGTAAGTHLVTDLRPGPDGSNVGSLTAFKGRIYFIADDGRGPSLWRTGGTAPATVRVKATGSYSALWNLGKRLVFLGYTPRQGVELWSSDGSARRTAPLGDLVPGRGAPWFHDFALYGSRLYFIAEDGRGQELWLTDGTAAGTRRLTNLPRKEAFFSPAEGMSLHLPRHPLDSRVLFRAHDGAHGVEPWITDGTAKGTRLLRDVCPGACSGVELLGHAPLPGLAVFAADDGVRGSEPWVTDGTPKGTRPLQDLCPGSCGSAFVGLARVGSRLLFTARDGSSGRELWATDGTAAGTVRVSDFAAELPWRDSFDGVVAPGQLFFHAEDEEHGDELWRADGTPEGTRLVADINRTDLGGSYPSALRPLGARVVFVAYDGVSSGLWKSDGTAAGTVPFKTLGPDEEDVPSPEAPFAEAGGRLFYFARRGGLLAPWRTDGTDAGTFRLTEGDGPSCCVRTMRALGGTVLFDFHDPEHGTELWASDGTMAGTRLVLDIMEGASGSNPQELTAFQGRLYFSADDLDGRRELWASDGTAAGTFRVKDIHPDAGSSPTLLAVHAGRLWFFADAPGSGRELWVSDGTGAGTSLAVDFAPGSGSFAAWFMDSLGDKLVIASSSEGLWVTDGTPSGTRKIQEDSIFRKQRIVFQGRLYYIVANESLTDVLWVTDGTEAGTGPLLDQEGQEIHSPDDFAVLGDRLLFTSPSGDGRALWESDGTQAGTLRVQPVVLTSLTFPDVELVRAGGRVFFPARDRSTGVELWAVGED